MSEEHLLYDTGRLPIWFRLPIAIAGIFCLWIAAHEVTVHLFGWDLGLQATENAPPVLAFVCVLGLALLMFYAWFLRLRYFFDAGRGELLVRHSIFWSCSTRRISLSGAAGIYVDTRASGMFSQSESWLIGVEFKDGRREQFTTVQFEKDKNELAGKISECTHLPVLKT
jgi:hypothetical protein